MPGWITVALFAAALPNAVVLAPVANMYSKPSLEADVASQAIYGANVAVVESQSGWARVRTADDYLGWIPEASLRTGQPYAVEGRVAQVRSLFAHLYREPDVTAHAPLITAPFETRLEVTAEPGEHPKWAAVRLPDGRAAWAQFGDLEFNPSPLSAVEAVEFARRFLGLPYTWGGASSFGYDCSGFMQMLGRRRGLSMPRDAQPQSEWSGSKPVERKDLRPGDLLYFGAAQRVTHTGMYLGGGQFIDATTNETPMVRIDKLDDPHWSGIFKSARRVK
jgi:gamma-D-glutamyl-L-lysine dipeptidyl-peptidase